MSTDLRLQVIMDLVERVTAPLKRVDERTKKTSQALREARGQLQLLDKQQAAIKGLQSQQAAMRESANKLAVLKQQLQAVSTAQNGHGMAVKKAQKAVDLQTEALAKQRAKAFELRKTLTALGVNRVSDSQRRMTADIAAANAAIAEQKDRFNQLAKAKRLAEEANAAHAKHMKHAGYLAGSGSATVVAGTAMSLPVTVGLRGYSRFEDAMLGVARQVEGARDDNGNLTRTYFDMANEIKRLSTTIPLATTEIARIVEAGARMGIQGKENLLSFARTTAMTAAAFDLPVDEVGEQMGKLAELYKIPIPAISTLGDVINHLDDNALSKGGDIINVMQRIAGTAAGVNMSAREAAALGSSFLSLGASPEVAGTASNAMIRELSIASMQSKQFQQGLKKLGLDAKSIQVSMPKNATGTILMVLDKIKAVSGDQRIELATRLFGKEYGDDAAKLAENLDEYRRQLKLVNDERAKGSMRREGDARSSTLSAQGQILSNKASNLISGLGESIAEDAKSIMEWLGRITERLSKWVSENPVLVRNIMRAIAVVAALTVAMGSFLITIAAIFGPFKLLTFMLGRMGMSFSFMSTALRIASLAFKFLGNTLLSVGRLMLANPVLLVIAAIAGAAYLIYTNWDTIKAWFLDLWDKIGKGVDDAFKWIGQVIGNFSPLDLIYSAFAGLLRWLGIDMPAKFTDFGSMLMTGLINGIRSKLAAVKDAVGEAATGAINRFKDLLGIKSPSRVFLAAGANVADGAALGIQRNTRSVRDAAAALAAATAIGLPGLAGAAAPGLAPLASPRIDARPPLASRAGAAQVIVQGDTITIQLPGGGGNDLQAMTRAITAELDRREAAKHARIRSALADIHS